MLTRERCEDSFLIASYEADFSGMLSLYALFNRFQELAGIHAAHLQVGYETLQQTKAGVGAFQNKSKDQFSAALGQDCPSCYMAERNRPAFCAPRFLYDR